MPFRVSTQAPLVVRVPGTRPFTGAMALEMVDESGKRIAANYVNRKLHEAIARAVRIYSSLNEGAMVRHSGAVSPMSVYLESFCPQGLHGIYRCCSAGRNKTSNQCSDAEKNGNHNECQPIRSPDAI